ncbi:hypothetical protein Q4Q34_18690 [Flavivirga abyssicola]|nr:hypothetical protein [Flavivirga sp. MEBiC07777]WVK13244.1 hypothetical protein Q4Q34_18690 [Flavivirga sp. MEBiC07777]
MKTDTKLRRNQLFLPMGFGWYTGAKPSVKKPINRPTENIDKVYYT